ncbi:NADH dehydrogenase [ubiquinone] 1 beta subcomplex subunit 7 isoform X2 [Bombina bombina]|uniref:NADH dehydrogenase [ubiquinone] 1 beta subcomplex subunit 7 isoform X2 n=1 Tax=Bombina bombina TaxID=8345 RepID=UPI00235AC7AB|nr:NADH dehydrogenase [ubiquinone] 1 beta subcomplex subunit 7 isoform X2 [Bombina bombina]
MAAHLLRRYRGDPEPDPNHIPGPEPGERSKERVMVASQEQMNLAQLPLEQRDYCAHHLIKLMKCKRDMWPNFLACKHERHEWDLCQHQETEEYQKTSVGGNGLQIRLQ